MTDTLKRVYGPAQLGTSAATLYTVPASTTFILRYMRFNNTTSTDRSITISIGANAAATQIVSAMTVPANGAIDWTGSIPMTTTEILQGLAAAATAITAVVSGVEIA